jgi:hypothetical protein
MPKQSDKNKQIGGEFTNEEINELHELGFNDEHIQILTDNNLLNIQLARNSLQEINPNTGNNFTPQEIIDSLQIDDDMNNTNDSLNESIISLNSDDSEMHDLDDVDDNDDFNFENNYDDSMNTTIENVSMNINPNNDDSFESDDSLHLSDLANNSNLNDSNNTSIEEESFGGKSKKRKNNRHNKRKTMKKGYKKSKRKTMKKGYKKGKRKTTKKGKRKTMRSRRMKGGNVDQLGSADFNPNLAYDSKQIGGQNVGGNCYDPNFSIYNTRELTLFPYNPK